MPVLLYIHGFRSSPRSAKAQQLKAWLSEHRPDVHFTAPYLTPYPEQSRETLDAIVDACGDQQLGLVGSSLGGFWATYLAESYDLRAALVNPSVNPGSRMPEYLELDFTGWYDENLYRLKPRHVEEIQAVDVAITDPTRYWLMVQTGDETLDYRDAVKKYKGAKQLVEEGGNHSFENFDQHFPDILQFLFDESQC